MGVLFIKNLSDLWKLAPKIIRYFMIFMTELNWKKKKNNRSKRFFLTRLDFKSKQISKRRLKL